MGFKFLDKSKTVNDQKVLKSKSFNLWNVLGEIQEDISKNKNPIELIDNLDASNISSIVFFMNKALVYNSLTRSMLPELIKTSNFLDGKAYLEFLFKFLLKHKVKFNKWSPMPVFGSKKIENLIKEKININDDEMEILNLYLSSKNIKQNDFLEIIERTI